MFFWPLVRSIDIPIGYLVRVGKEVVLRGCESYIVLSVGVSRRVPWAGLADNDVRVVCIKIR